MTYEELLTKIQSGELPSAGIIRRSAGAKDVIVTTQHNGETVVIPDVSMGEEEPTTPEETT